MSEGWWTNYANTYMHPGLTNNHAWIMYIGILCVLELNLNTPVRLVDACILQGQMEYH
jgi:hypothetical protein